MLSVCRASACRSGPLCHSDTEAVRQPLEPSSPPADLKMAEQRVTEWQSEECCVSDSPPSFSLLPSLLLPPSLSRPPPLLIPSSPHLSLPAERLGSSPLAQILTEHTSFFPLHPSFVVCTPPPPFFVARRLSRATIMCLSANTWVFPRRKMAGQQAGRSWSQLLKGPASCRVTSA